MEMSLSLNLHAETGTMPTQIDLVQCTNVPQFQDVISPTGMLTPFSLFSLDRIYE